MQREEFERRIRSLLPRASKAALDSFSELAEEPEVQETMGSSDFYDALYVDLALVKRDHGENIAVKLFNYGEHYPFNPFELRGAARLMAGGWTPEQISGCMIEHGFEEPFCAYTPEEEAESEALLWSFQHGRENLPGLEQPEHPAQQFGGM